MRSVFIVILAAVFISRAMAMAGAAPLSRDTTKGMSLRALIGEALKSNARLLAVQERFQAAKARVNFFRELPDPELEYEYDRITPSTSSMGSGKVAPMKSLAFSQEIPFPTKLFLKKRMAQREAAALNEEFEEMQRSLVKEVKDAYYNILLSRRQTTLARESLSLLKQLTASLSAAYSVNKVIQQDVLRAQVETARVQNELLLYAQEERVAAAWLVSLLGREDNVEVGEIETALSEIPSPTETEVISLTKANRPELKAYRSLLDKARLGRSLSRQAFLPDVTFRYRREDKDGSFKEGAWAGSVAINVPLWFWGKQASGVREAQANFAAAQADYQAEENSVVFEAKSTLAKYEAARAMARVYEAGILPQAAGVVSTARRAYESGTGDLTAYLDALRMQRQWQSEYVQALTGTLTALADLEQVIGSDLEH